MREPIEHGEGWQAELAAYALDALDQSERTAIERHLGGCDACRERVRWLSPAVDVLPAAVAQQQPPPPLRERLMAIAEQEASLAPRPAARPAPASRRSSWRSALSGFSLRPALAGLAVALLLAAGILGYSLRDDGSPETRTFAAVPLEEDSPAAGTLSVSGDQGTLEVRNLPAAGRHEVYQAWIRRTGDEGATVPSSVFVLSKDGSGSVAIPSGLEGAQEVMVTREPVGGSEKPHEGALVVAKLR